MTQLSRSGFLQGSAGLVAGSALTGGLAPASAADRDGLHLALPRLNAGTGGSPLTDEVVRALATPVAPVADPAFVKVFARTTRLLARILDTDADVLLIPGEAILALEAAFRSVTRPGLKAMNVISGVYGADYTNWLKAYGADVVEVRVPFDASVAPAAVEAALAQHPETQLLTVVHVDTPSGTANDVARICAAAKRRGVVTLVDAAASLGGMPLYPDRWGIDIAIGAAHKSIGSPVGFGVTTVSHDAWRLIDANTNPPEDFSILDLRTWRETWVRNGKVPSTVSPTITYGAYAAAHSLVHHGVHRGFVRTARAARAFRAGARAGGIALWAAPGAIPAPTATALTLPAGVSVDRALHHLRRRHGVAAAGSAFTGDRVGQTLRFGHMGPIQTDPDFVLDLLDAVLRGWHELGGHVNRRAGLRAARRILR